MNHPKKPPQLKQLISARKVADRYGVHLRTISRWVASDAIPPPDQIIGDKRFWYVTSLEEADRNNTVKTAAGWSSGIFRHCSEQSL